MRKKQVVAWILAGAVVMTSAASGGSMQKVTAAENETLEWMNYDSQFPIVKEDYEKTLSIYVAQSDDFGPAEESWMYQWLTNECNVKLEITTFTGENRDELISLAFASNELPDIIIGAGFSTVDLLKYGVDEEQIIDIAPYVNEAYMPNLTALYEEYPEFRTPVTDSEGRMWSLGYIANPEARSSLGRAFINYDWMEELGRTLPETLDEFTDLMRAFKEAGYCDYPISGSSTATNPSAYLLNALGYVGNPSNGERICLRNGEVVLPYYDREVFGEYLKLMKQYYDEGLIHPDFFTMDSTTASAVMSQGMGFVLQAPLVYTADYIAYWGAMPLTSEWNDTRTWWTSDSVTAGNVVITSECEEPELAARFLDIFYNMDNDTSGYRLAVHGPQSSQTDILYGVSGWEMIDGKFVYLDYEDNKEQYNENSALYLKKEIQLWNSGIVGVDPWHFTHAEYAYWGEVDYQNEYSKEELPALRHTDEAIMGSGDKCYGVGIQSTAGEYVVTDTYPSAVYMDADEANRNTELKTAMDEYADQEIAKFITGARELNDSELEDYFNTLESLGAEEYVQSYTDYYAAIKSE